ncbi:hypothetical protein B0H14DRAFT_2624564 [Mycena olivaceomarginata]|nr:hypothetical protein B0H14DRAFT_2624564 [Mycena olivaceomarginata]
MPLAQLPVASSVTQAPAPLPVDTSFDSPPHVDQTMENFVPNYVGLGDPALDLLGGVEGEPWFGDDLVTGEPVTFDANGEDIVPAPRPFPRPMHRTGVGINLEIGGSPGYCRDWTNTLRSFPLPPDVSESASPSPAPPSPAASADPAPSTSPSTAAPPNQTVSPITVATATAPASGPQATETPRPSAFFTASLGNSAPSFPASSTSVLAAGGAVQSRPMGNPLKPPARAPAAKSKAGGRKNGGKRGVAKENADVVSTQRVMPRHRLQRMPLSPRCPYDIGGASRVGANPLRGTRAAGGESGDVAAREGYLGGDESEGSEWRQDRRNGVCGRASRTCRPGGAASRRLPRDSRAERDRVERPGPATTNNKRGEAEGGGIRCGDRKASKRNRPNFLNAFSSVRLSQNWVHMVFSVHT